MTDIEIYQSANLMIKQFGDRALIEAAIRQDKLASDGNLGGAKAWSRIGQAIEWLQMPAELTTDTIQ